MLTHHASCSSYLFSYSFTCFSCAQLILVSYRVLHPSALVHQSCDSVSSVRLKSFFFYLFSFSAPLPLLLPSSLSSSLLMSPEEWYKSLLTVTRVYWSIAVLTTIGATIGIISPAYLYLDFDLVFGKFQVSAQTSAQHRDRIANSQSVNGEDTHS